MTRDESWRLRENDAHYSLDDQTRQIKHGRRRRGDGEEGEGKGEESRVEGLPRN